MNALAAQTQAFSAKRAHFQAGRARLQARAACRPACSRVGGRRSLVVQAFDPSAALAVGQQDLMFALVAGGELAYQLTDRPKEKGSPSIPIVGPCLAACLAAWGLLASGNDGLAHIGLFAGLVGSGAIGFHCVQRIEATQSRPEDWPGAKIYPVGLAFISFLAILANVEGIMNV